MIIYGSRGKQLATRAVPAVACPACQQCGQLVVGLASRYVHVYWVPLFPYEKEAVAQCRACGYTAAAPALPPALLAPVQALRRAEPHPYWTWTGLAALALLALGGLLYGIHDHHRDEALLARPQAGDIYTVRSDSATMYSLLKVRRVGGNGVELVANQFQTPDSNPLATLNQDSSYSDEPFVITRLDLQIMRRKGELTDVERP